MNSKNKNQVHCQRSWHQPYSSTEMVLYSDLIQDWNIQILNIICKGNPIITIINLYNNYKQYNEYVTILLHTILLSYN